MVYLGVDAGNSKTDALVCAADGTVLGSGRAGCGDLYGAGEDGAVRAVRAAAEAALEAAGASSADVGAAAFRLAGVDWADDAAYWHGVIDGEWPRVSVLNDGYAPLRCGDPSGIGVAVLAGTGAAIGARGPVGDLWHLGFWAQHELGAHGLVGEALRALTLAELGLAPATALTPALLAHYGQPDVATLREWLTRRHGRATQEQRLAAARTVAGVAADGDAVAAAIVDEQGRRLAAYAGVAARKVGLTGGLPVVAAGSVLAAPGSPVLAALTTHLAAVLPGARLVPAGLPPVAGAALDALAEGGVPVTGAVVARLAADLRVPDQGRNRSASNR